MLETLLITLQACGPVTLLKWTPTQVFFEEHLRTSAPETLRKKLILFIVNINLTKLVCAIFTLYQNAICYLLQASEEGKSDNDNDFKILEPPIEVKQFPKVLNKQNVIFEITIFSHPLNFFHSYLIYFYTHEIGSPENIQHTGILAHLKRLLKNVSR